MRLLRYLEVIEDSPGQWCGACVGMDIYLMKWDVDVFKPRFRPLMEAQVVTILREALPRRSHAASGVEVRCSRSRNPSAAWTLT